MTTGAVWLLNGGLPRSSATTSASISPRYQPKPKMTVPRSIWVALGSKNASGTITVRCWHEMSKPRKLYTVPKVFLRAWPRDLLPTRQYGYATKMTVITDRNRPVHPWDMSSACLIQVLAAPRPRHTTGMGKCGRGCEATTTIT